MSRMESGKPEESRESMLWLLLIGAMLADGDLRKQVLGAVDNKYFPAKYRVLASAMANNNAGMVWTELHDVFGVERKHPKEGSVSAIFRTILQATVNRTVADISRQASFLNCADADQALAILGDMQTQILAIKANWATLLEPGNVN